ncbi:hypothetical protein C7B65_10535 [Phormidesmis priestleyi ULC007]|uniref:Uncharacterized protein n=1 Tax=Phormidesmis priestleyi ULC007 TaxID=1920490 RepID=A0A2T1DH02_9CYAN|nr:hypothetical protein [Phormidesmis priestleyi]PSB19721.1 hypothetical protein C7B65_10535 [Phormidesmis priestleyi ULC007]PZO53605.1 MAG: hypothetical protein DCF14_04240 [Phormidesmis priestleyi]
MRTLHLSGAIFLTTLALQACSGRYQTPIAFPGSSSRPAPTVQKSPIVTPQKPVRPAVTTSPTATEADLRVCTTLSPENRRLVAFETANYLVNVCQKGTQGRIFYLGRQKGKPNSRVQVTATSTQRGYRAIDGNTTYVVETQSGGKLIVLQNGQKLFQEPAIGTVITASKPEPSKENRPGAGFRLTCRGDINDRNLYFTVIYTQESGFTTFELRQKGSDRLISQGRVAFSGRNNQGQTIYRGAAKNADVVVVGFAPHYQKPFSEMSFSIDGQWGRGTCRQLG